MKKAERELGRLTKMSSYNPESSYIRTYLDWLVELPWSLESPNQVDITIAEKILNDVNVALIPGDSFGAEGYIRIDLPA